MGGFSTEKVATVLGLVGMIVSEIYEFLTWHIETITGEFSIQTSFNWAFPEFYLGLLVSIGMLVCYLLIEKFEIL